MKVSSDDFVIFSNINQNCNFRIIVNIVLQIEGDWKQMRNVIVTFPFIGGSSVSVSFPKQVTFEITFTTPFQPYSTLEDDSLVAISLTRI